MGGIESMANYHTGGQIEQLLGHVSGPFRMKEFNQSI